MKAQTKPKKPLTKTETVVGSVIFVVLVIGVVWGLGAAVVAAAHHNSTPHAVAQASKPVSHAASKPTAAIPSSAATLAEYDLGHAPDAATTAKYQTALDALKPLCTETEAKLISEIHNSWQDLENNGVTDETHLTLTQHVADSIPAGSPATDCAQIMAAYLLEREPAN